MSTMTRPAPLVDEQPIVERSDTGSGAIGENILSLLTYALIGAAFGVVLTKSEAVSWFRIQEMFRFQSVHMYGIIGSAVAVASLSLYLIRKSGARSVRGESVVIPPKERTPFLRRYWVGGTVFGMGWALVGACPGPIFALVGSGLLIMLVPLGTALLGTWAYAWLRPRLPH